LAQTIHSTAGKLSLASLRVNINERKFYAGRAGIEDKDEAHQVPSICLANFRSR
jgi:hypothetical protein